MFKNMYSSRRIAIGLAIIISVAVLGFRRFLFSPEWPAGGDIWSHISRQYLAKDFRWLFTWRDQSFGYVEGINLMDSFFLVADFVVGNAANAAKIFAFFSYVLAGFSMYAFGYRYTGKSSAALAGSLVYILNQWLFTQLTEGHLDILFSYALAPIVFMFFDRALATGRMKYILASSVLFAIMLTSFHPQAIFIYCCFLALFAVLELLRPRRPRRRLLRSLVALSTLALGLSALVWIPALLNVRGYYFTADYGFTLEETYSYGYRSFAEAFTLAGNEKWGYVGIVDVTKEVSLQILPVTTILLVVFAVAYAVTYVFKTNRYSIFFGLCALISILISMGPYSPFSSCFSWAWLNIPFSTVFRTTSRWAMMIALSNSFFVCSSVSVLTVFRSKIVKQPQEHTDTSGIPAKKYTDLPSPQDTRSSISFSTRISKGARNYTRYLVIIFLIFVFLSGFLSNWFFLSHGLEVYTPPDNYLEPYEYIRGIPGDYKIVTISRSYQDWFSTSDTDTDFGYQSMLTPIGWSHDLGSDSSFITDKPVLQNGGWARPSADFVTYLRRCLAVPQMTRNILKMLGAFGYKYIVIPAYATEAMRDFIMFQDGGKVVYNESDAVILENEFYMPRVFVPVQCALVFGGLRTLNSLYGINSFSLNTTALVMANQADNLLYATRNLHSFGDIVFPEMSLTDLVLTYLRDPSLIYAVNYGKASSDATKYWIKSSYFTDNGAVVLGGNTLTTYGNNVINIPFEVMSEGTYETWIRIGFTQNRGKLLVSMDGVPIAEIKPQSDFSSTLKWVNLVNSHLEKGSHVITMTNDGTGYNDIDAIAVIDQNQMKNLEEGILSTFMNFNGRTLCIIDAEEAFSIELPKEWTVERETGEGYILHLEGGPSASYLANASASSVSDNLEAYYAIDGNYGTRWASSTGMPQWLELSWPTPQELLGVTVNFERAVAKDYTIQAWNETGWVDLINVKDNELLRRFHPFPQTVTTSRLRILITSAPAYDTVSIYELETYSLNNAVSSKIFAPKSGDYTIDARMMSDGTSNGTLYIKVDDKLFSCSSVNDSELVWQRIDSTFLEVGEHSISISALGKVYLDKIGLYSSENSTFSIDDFFESELAVNSPSYEKINSCEYIIHANLTEPRLLVFSESYHPLWKAYVDGEETSQVIVNSLANGFFINKTGNFDITLYFTGQRYADFGLIISGGSVVFAAIVVIANSVPAKRLCRLLKTRFSKARRERNLLPKQKLVKCQEDLSQRLNDNSDSIAVIEGSFVHLD